MVYFINFCPIAGLYVTTYRQPDAFFCDHIGQLIEDKRNNVATCCDLEGVKETLEDGAYWAGSDVTEEELEEIHTLICEFEAKQ